MAFPAKAIASSVLWIVATVLLTDAVVFFCTFPEPGETITDPGTLLQDAIGASTLGSSFRWTEIVLSTLLVIGWTVWWQRSGSPRGE